MTYSIEILLFSSGTTESFSVQELVMQGTVWAGLRCAATMNKLCKSIYNNDNLLIKYKCLVQVPPLQMDNIKTAINCGNKSKLLNAAVGTFLNHTQLKLSATKCVSIHVGKKHKKSKCPKKNIDMDIIKEPEKEKYLGNF